MKVTVLFCYTEDTIPKGCRKPRPTRFDDGRVDVELREVSEVDAPVALRRTDFDYGREKVLASVDYRWFEGKFWVDRRIDSDIREEYGNGPDGEIIDARKDGYSSCKRPACNNSWQGLAENTRQIREWADGFILINGRGWFSIEEPCYYVDNSSMHATWVSLVHGVDSFRRREAFYSLNEGKKAEVEAQKDNAHREFQPVVMPRSKFEIVMPETIQVNIEPKKKVKVFGIGKTTYGGNEYVMVEVDLDIPPDAIEKKQHLEIAKRELIGDGPLPDIIFDEWSPIGKMIVGMRNQIENLKLEKQRLMGKSDINDGKSVPVLEF